jgi:hypothetical protein
VSSASSTTTLTGDAPRPAQRRERTRTAADVGVYLGIAAALAAVWYFSRYAGYTAQSDTGYALGVAGGVAMLLLFLYPLRKRWGWLSRWGSAKPWFVAHMLLGVGGPLLILAHSTFRIGSLNAGVALFSMLIVAGSGVVGRFIYLRIHRGLGGERETLEGLRDELGLDVHAVRRRLAFAPQAEEDLRVLAVLVAKPSASASRHLHSICILPWQAHALQRRCLRDIDQALRQQGLPPRKLRALRRDLRSRVRAYVRAVLRASQFAAYVRLFSLWHVLHVPFVYLMVICAVVHVVAVHAY